MAIKICIVIALGLLAGPREIGAFTFDMPKSALKGISSALPSAKTISRGLRQAKSSLDSLTPSSSGASSASGNDYEAMCFMQRDPQWSDDPTLHFFSYKKHLPKTFGCSDDHLSFRLDVNEAIDQDRPDEERLQAEMKGYEERIKSELIDTHLYDPELPTYLFTHGFMANWNGDPWMCQLKDVVLNSSRANVFITDWSGGSKPMLPIDYGAAVTNTKFAARLIGVFMEALLKVSGQSDAGNLHLIGHSLGGHISGFIGYSLNGTVGRITALDPAGPCFGSNSKSEETASSGFLSSDGRRRLSAASAKLVVALHTDCSLFGLNENCAHYDVYINGGSSQAGCTSLIDVGTKFADLVQLKDPGSFSLNLVCAHSYAHQLLDGFANVPEKDTSGLLNNPDPKNPNKCQPVAFECSSWNAFTSGECGLCRDDKPECLYIGLQLGRLVAGQQVVPDEAPKDEPKVASEWQSADDDIANGELVNPNNGTSNEFQVSALVSRDRHFIRSGAGVPHCRFHYQLIVAATPSGRQSSRLSHHRYVQLPLGDRWRLARLSHAVRIGTPAHSRLANQLNDNTLFGDPSERALLGALSQLEFYTALITFASTLDCAQVGPVGQDWALCEPLAPQDGVRLWSSSESRVKTVKWVALNLMSSPSQADRKRGSKLFRPANTVKVRSDLDESKRATLVDLRAGKASQPLDCLVGTVQALARSSQDDSDLNSSCDRSNHELSHWATLKPIIKAA